MAQWLRVLWCRISRYLVRINAEAIQGVPVSPGARQRAGQLEVAEHQSYQARHCCRVVIRQRPGKLLALQPEILPPATRTSSTDAWQGYIDNTYLQGPNMLKAFGSCQTEVTAVPTPSNLTGASYAPPGFPGLPQMGTGLERAQSMRTALPDPKQRALQLAFRVEARAAAGGRPHGASRATGICFSNTGSTHTAHSFQTDKGRAWT